MATLYNPIPISTTKFSSDSYTDGSIPATFDARLYRPLSDRDELKLTIELRLKLVQAPPGTIYPIVFDADGKPFLSSPWTPGDWSRFVAAATTQANMWNDKFWLVPPPSFSKFDLKFETFGPNQAWRPNVRCELLVDFAPSGEPHKEIRVVNLNLNNLGGQKKDSNIFRSHSLLYDSLDTVPWVNPMPAPGEPAIHHTIAHEVGHAMGLGHIGTIKRTLLCEFAISSENAGVDKFDWKTAGGRNSYYCYGHEQGIALAGNIMGAGSDFSVENARAWLWAIGTMSRNPAEASGWRAVKGNPGTGLWVRV